jgi:hypothetical protein
MLLASIVRPNFLRSSDGSIVVSCILFFIVGWTTTVLREFQHDSKSLALVYP